MRNRDILLSGAVVGCLVAAPAGAHEAAVALRARAETPAVEAAADRAGLRGVDGGNQLFFMTGLDNAACVRSISDVNGDGKDEVLVGIDESGTDNIFCLDGASTGPASVVWSLETADGVSGGSPYGDQSLLAVSDTDDNGSRNLLAGTAGGGRTAYNLDGENGAIFWKFDTYLEPDSGWIYSLAELDDITGDAVPETAFGAGSPNDSVYLVDGASGPGQATALWRYAAGDAVYSVRSLGDVNGDGDDDVLAAVGDNVDVVVVLDGGTSLPGGDVVWQYSPGASVFAAGRLPDITGDEVDEALAVLWTLDGSAIRCLDGATGALLWSSTQVGENGMMVDALEDVTGDGIHEVVVSSWENAVIVLDGADGSLVWKTVVGTTNGGDVWTARAIDDLDGDGRQDVIAGSFDYHVYALDGDDGTIFWAFNTDNRIFSVAPVGDLNGDGRPEVAAGTQDTNNDIVLHVLEGDSGLGTIFLDGFESGDTSAWSATVP